MPDMGADLKPQQRDGNDVAMEHSLTQVSICKDDHRIGGEQSLLDKTLFVHLPRSTYRPRSGIPVSHTRWSGLHSAAHWWEVATSLFLSSSILRRFASLHRMSFSLIACMRVFHLTRRYCRIPQAFSFLRTYHI